MRQHGATHHVAYSPNIGQVGFAVVVHHNGAALVQLQAHGFAVQTNGVGHTTDGDDQLINVQRLRFAFGIGVSNRQALLGRLDFTNLDTQLNLQALLGKGLVSLFSNLFIHSTQEGRQTFENRHLRPQTAPDRAHFQTDNAGTDQAQLLGHSAYAQRAVVGQNALFIKVRTRQGTGIGTSGHNDVLTQQRVFSSPRHVDDVAVSTCAHKGTTAVEERNLVLLKQVLHTIVVLFNDGVLAGQHFGDVHRDVGG